MKVRLALITEIIAPYRVPVFNALAARDDVDLHVIFLAETDPKLRQWAVPKNEIRFSYEVLPSIRLWVGSANLLVNRARDAYPARLRQRLNPRSYVDSITKDVAFAPHHIPEIDSYSETHSSALRYGKVGLHECFLYTQRSEYRILNAWKLSNHGIPCCICYSALVLFYYSKDDFPVLRNAIESVFLVCLHEMAVAVYIRAEYGDKLSFAGC